MYRYEVRVSYHEFIYYRRHPAHPLSVLILHPNVEREILWQKLHRSQNYKTLRTGAVYAAQTQHVIVDYVSYDRRN